MTSTPFMPRRLAVTSALVLACSHAALAGTSHPTEELALPKMCQIDTSTSQPSAAQPEDCFEFGASVGELGLNWRKQLPQHVRWLTRKDAISLCKLTQSELGKLVDSRVPDGCVFLAPAVCTIVTAGHIAPVSLSNAVRHCVP